MELVIGLSSNKLAHIVTDQGARESVAVAQLKTRGIPLGRFKAGRLITDFEGWRLLDVEEANAYPQAFGIQADMLNHQVFEFYCGIHIYHVPAIAVIRALLRNKARLMSAMFQPQGLDNAVTPVFDGERFSTCVLPGSAHHELHPAYLTWLYAYPSARRMFHSIFQYALKSQLGVMLPCCVIEIRPRFNALHRLHKIRYVTDLNIITIKTGERPLGFFDTKFSFIRFYRGTGGTKLFTAIGDIPIASSEYANLSDSEWADIELIFDGARFKHDLRSLLNGILHKIVSGKSWRQCTYQTGSWSNASNLYQVLMKDGKWLQILSVLRKHRSGDS